MMEKEASGTGESVPAPAPNGSLAEILAGIAAGASIWDADLRLVAWNAHYRDILAVPERLLQHGASLAEILDNCAPLFEDSRTGEQLSRAILSQLATANGIEVDRVQDDGRVISVTYYGLSGGNWLALYRDVTERRRDIRQIKDTARALELQNARLDVALASMPYGFSIWDDQYRLVLFNRRYAEIYAMPLEQIRVGMTLREVCVLTVGAGNHPDTTVDELFDTYRDRLLAVVDPTNDGVYEKLIKGRTIKTTYARRPALGWVITHEDVTEDRAKLAALRDSEEDLRHEKLRLEAAVNNMSHGLCMFDANRRLVICNDNYAKIYGLPPNLMKQGTPVEAILSYRYDHGVNPSGGKEAYFQRRLEMVEQQKPAVDIVELHDGRVISVIHHPMDDGGWVSTHQDITEQRKTEARIRHLARHDTLTDLPNRLMFGEIMDAAEQRIGRNEVLAVLAIDLDHFKTVNDTLGHGMGDAVLKMVGDRLRASCREGDIVARLGGDEFAILTSPLAHPHDAAGLADRIVKHAAEPFEIDRHTVAIGASVGIAVAPGDGGDAETLLKNADLALYRAKHDGRGAYHFFEKGMDAALQERRALEMGLRQALARNEFRLVFQPLFNLKEGRICGLEALIRWYHPERGTIPPADFIPIAEEVGLIVPIGDWVLREACRAAVSWPEDIHIAVNLSTVQFRNRNLYQHVKTALDESGLQAERLELEVTESLLLVDNASTLKTLFDLRKLGVRISMDDFGTGYSSLSYLRSFPFDKIKIDRSFVHDMSTGEDSQAIVKAVIGLGRSLGMSTAAEGVETEAQLDLVRRQGCTEVQGFLFSPPLPAAAIDRLFADAGGMDAWTRTLRHSA